jgi:dienelactone hydrolase
MKLKNLILLTFLSLGLNLFAVTISTQWVDYQDGDVKLRGYFARPSGEASVPGVLVVHDWYGMSDYVVGRANQLAELGYAAFSLDMNGVGKSAKDSTEAKALTAPFYSNRSLMVTRAQAGLTTLKKQKGVDTKKIAAMGYCFGGSTVLQLARSGEPLLGVVSFHGGLKTTSPAKAGDIKAKLLVLHGGAEIAVPPAELAAFIDEMNTAKATWRMEVYGGAVHAFTRPDAGTNASKGVAYNAEADKRSFSAMSAFFKEIF